MCWCELAQFTNYVRYGLFLLEFCYKNVIVSWHAAKAVYSRDKETTHNPYETRRQPFAGQLAGSAYSL